MRPITISPCKACGATLEHDQDPRTVLCVSCRRQLDKLIQAVKPPPPEPPPLRTPEKHKGITGGELAVAFIFSFGFAGAFLGGWIARGGA